MSRLPALALLTLALAACGTAPKKPDAQAAGTVVAPPSHSAGAPAAPAAPRVSPYAAAQEDPGTRGHYVAGGLYRPGVADTVPDYIPDVDAIPEPQVVDEPRSAYGNRSPYTVLGQQYTVLADHAGFVETGLASYYGNKFHGRRTSNLEVYDMYAFTAAHKSLPLPSFARVTNLENGRSVVVRVNDRGPFHDGRVIDLSYAAAVKLGYRERGTARVEVRALLPGEDAMHRPADTRLAVAPAAISGIDQLVRQLPATPATTMPMAATATALATNARPATSASSGTRAADRRSASRTTVGTGIAASAPASTTSTAALAGPAVQEPAAAAPALPHIQPNPAGERFDLYQNGRAMTADEFDAWMAQRQLRVATGQPTRIASPAAPASGPSGSVAATATAAATPAPSPAMTSPQASAPTVASTAVAAAGERVVLQVASFANQGNAGEALARLRGADIADARLADADVDGRRIWRLRIGPVDAARAGELAARVAGLGFGTPQRVRE